MSICIDHFDEYLRREWPCHWHDEFEFGLVLKGSVEFSIFDGRRKSDVLILHEGDGAFINSTTLHSVRSLESDTVMAGFVFPISFFDIRPFGSIHQGSILPITDCGLTGMVFHRKEAKNQPLLTAMRELCTWNENDPCFDLHCIEMVCKIWRLLSERIREDHSELEKSPASSIQEQRLKELVSYVHAHFRERITVEDMARHACISRTECFRCFQAIMGKSPMEYITEYRLSMATMLLSNTTQAISDIALSCGFCSPSYFGKLFREECGITPKQYREQIKQIENQR